MADADEADLKENRFSYLLQPIRDLAANWDINIAGELEEYLEELENLSFTIEGCAGPSLNFAEAALLIQGTTCVFSKKVEYLHNLVYQALETIFNKRSQAKQAAAGSGGAGKAAVKAAAAAAAGLELDSPEGFYALLSQTLEVAAATEIDLGDDDETAPPELLRPPTALLALEDAACGQGNAASSSNGPGEDTCRLARCTVHISGALLLEGRDGQQYNALLRPLLLPGALGCGSAAAAAACRATLQHGLGAAAVAAAAAAGAAAAAADGSELSFAGAADAEQQQQLQEVRGMADDGDLDGGDMGHEGYGGDYDDAAYADAGGDMLTAAAAAAAAEDGLGAEQQPAEGAAAAALDAADGDDVPEWLSREGGSAAEAAAEGAAAAAADGDATVRQTRQRRGRGDAVAAAAGGADGDGFYDPYTPLDPTAPGTLPVKPLQVRKPKRPARLAALPDLTAAPGFNANTTTGFIGAVERLNASHHPTLQWPEFGHLLDKLAAAAAAAAAAGKGSRRGRGVVSDGAAAVPGLLLGAGGPVPAAVLDWNDAAAAAAAEQAAMEQHGDDATAGDWDAGVDGYDNDFSFDDEAAAAAAAAAAGAAGGLSPWAAAALGGGGEGGNMPGWMAGAGGDRGDGSQTYEELCRSHIESLIHAAAAAQTQSELAQRVSTWRQRIDPILKAEEDRSAFDIHTYGTHILTRLVSITEENVSPRPGSDTAAAAAAAAAAAGSNGGSSGAADFVQVAGAADSFEVCRAFAAMLQLVNNRNINLIRHSQQQEDNSSSSSSGGSSQVCNNLQLQLLSVARVHEAMAEGLAGEGANQQELPTNSQAGPPPRAASKPKAKKGGKARQPGSQATAAAAAAAAAADSDGGPAKQKQQHKKTKGRQPGGSSSEDDVMDDVSSSSGSDGELGAGSDSDVENQQPQRPAAAKGKSSKAAAGANKGSPVGAKEPVAKRARRALQA